jgi:hypothetical protein
MGARVHGLPDTRNGMEENRLLARTPTRSDGSRSATVRVSGEIARRVTMVLDPASARAVHGVIAARLSQAGVTVSLSQAPSSHDIPSSVELLLTLERMVTRGHAALGARCELAALALPTAIERPDLTIDFSGNAAASGRTLRLVYDGVAGERGLMGALFAGRLPSIAFQDVATGAVVSHAQPGADSAATIHAALEAVLAAVATLTQQTVRGFGNSTDAPTPVNRAPGLPELIAFETRTLARAAVSRLYRLCCHSPHWRVCWRRVDHADLFDAKTLTGSAWQVLPDPGTHFYADPFPFRHQGRTFLFVEDLDHGTQKGVISVVPFDDNGPSGAARVVLEEPWHLSYPFVFERDGEIWMIPESCGAGKVTLYRAARFPDRWVREADLLTGITASDATIVAHDGRLFMFAATRDAGSWSDTLSIFHAQHLLGPWQPHAANPILIDASAARPAGAFVRRNGTLWRPVQDCAGGYGTGIGLAEVTRLDTEGYAQTLHAIMRPPAGWPGRRLHTLNRAGALEFIDGSAHSPRSRFLAARLEGWSGRRELARHPD